MRFYARAACETLVLKTREQPAVLRGSVLPPGARKPLNDHNPDTPASARAWLSVAILLVVARSEEHTSELQSLMRISYAVFCLKKKNFHTQLRLVLLTYFTYCMYSI